MALLWCDGNISEVGLVESLQVPGDTPLKGIVGPWPLPLFFSILALRKANLPSTCSLSMSQERCTKLLSHEWPYTFPVFIGNRRCLWQSWPTQHCSQSMFKTQKLSQVYLLLSSLPWNCLLNVLCHAFLPLVTLIVLGGALQFKLLRFVYLIPWHHLPFV